ncbi:hypothetical protein P3102_15815 [Amycolatopsis sp. QT-25]|uniref:hypothetical protein n=1 Tax=Amycolatopsis sp. QT-25 TaxID=3034022 RepID=UPI0023ED9A3F|nr:hypothetical protein [Amycolatopsis sp. QT-25]WET82564.1 hypothetical protein P3102_15815 [Amycolatopsis sp. QT-25]
MLMKNGKIVWTANFILIALLTLDLYFAFGSAEINWWGVGIVTVLTMVVLAVEIYLLYQKARR